MARHRIKKHRKRSTKAVGKPRRSYRRKRVGAAGSAEALLMNGAGVAAGVVGAREGSILLGGMFPSLMGSPTTTGLIQAAAGGIGAYMAKSGFWMYAGLGAFGEGVMTLLNGLGVVGAPPQTMTYQFQNRKMMGDPRLQFVAGPQTRIGAYPNNFSLVAGIGAAGHRKPRYTS